jgi:hypothetical protein
VNTNEKRFPPVIEPYHLTPNELKQLTIPKLKDYFLRHWDWYTLATLTMQSSPSEMSPSAEPHIRVMADTTTACANVLKIRFGFSHKKAQNTIENWLDTGYEIPDDELM